MIVACSDKDVVRQVRAVFAQNGVRPDRIHEHGPHLSDTTIHLMINDKLGDAQAAQIRAAVSRIAGASIQAE
jgi:hypothetical protein